MTTRLATTVLLVRGGPRGAGLGSGLEVFMVQRHRRSGFLPNAWVFPGGRVDPADHELNEPVVQGGDALLDQLGGGQVARAHAVAGVRETWEEVGVWLGDGPPPAEARGPVARGEQPLSDVLGDQARIHLDRLAAWSWWVTPEAEPRRYDTRFLITDASGADGRHDEHETVDSRWIRPEEALELGMERFPLAPPTWWTLVELARLGTAAAALGHAPGRELRPIQPIMQFSGDGIDLRLPGHADHPEDEHPELPHRITWDDGRWVGWRRGRSLTLP